MTTQTQTDSNMNNTNYLGSMMLIIGGIVVFFLLVLGSLTDNRFGAHMVLSTDLSSGPIWYLILISLISMTVVAAGIIFIILDRLNIFKMNDSRSRTLTTGSLFMMGSAAFVLALSSISFAAFNWQFFRTEIDNGIATAAIAMMSLSIIGIVASLGYIVFGMIVPINRNEKLYLTLRNTSIGLVALGWFVFNVCINSFGSMGGDAAVLVDGLLGMDDVLGKLSLFLASDKLPIIGEALSNAATMDAKTFYQTYLETIVVNQIGAPGKWLTAQTVFAPFYNKGTGPLVNQLGGFGQIVAEQGGLQNLLTNLGPVLAEIPNTIIPAQVAELGTGKEGAIMGVNNSFNSIAIFTALIISGFVGLPLYAGLTYKGTSREKRSIMFNASIIVIIVMALIYFFLLLTPYMVSYDKATQHVGLLGMLFNGDFGPSIAPGLIALPGEAGGIHSAIVYFSDEYTGTIVWWISEVLTFVTPVAAFVGTTLFLKLRKSK